jgi:hypothetical protein
VEYKDNSILTMENEKLKENANNKLVTLTWENINVYTPVQGNKLLAKIGLSKLTEPKHIVKDVNGVAKPGSLMAIMVNIQFYSSTKSKTFENFFFQKGR